MINKASAIKSVLGGTVLLLGAAAATQLPVLGKRLASRARRLTATGCRPGLAFPGNTVMTIGGASATDEDFERYVDGTPLVELFGDTPRTRFIAAVLSEPDETLTVEDIEQLSGVDPDQIEATAHDLDQKGFVTCHRHEDSTLRCQLETENPAVGALRNAEEGQIAYRRAISR